MHRWRQPEYLAVSDFWVSVGVCSEDSAQSWDSCVALKRRVFWERAVQVSFDLVCGQSAGAQRLLHQLSVVAGVSGHVVYSSCKPTVSPNTNMAVFSHDLDVIYSKCLPAGCRSDIWCTDINLKTASTALPSETRERLGQSSLVSSWWKTYWSHVRIQRNGCSKTAPSSSLSAEKQ